MIMNKIILGTICGLVFGVIDVLLMMPIQFPPEKDKPTAMIGAFVSRFVIGFVIGASNLPVPGWAVGLIFGILISLPDAIITRSYAPILIVGAIGGTVIGFVVNRWGAIVLLKKARSYAK